MATDRIVLTKYVTDTGGHIAGVKKIIDETEALGKKTKDAAKATSEGWGSVDSAIERTKRVFGDLRSVIGFASDSMKHFIDHSRMTAATSSVNIEGLRKASAGLKTEMQLLTDAAMFQRAAFKLNQKDMESVEGAMRGLERKGNDTMKVQAALTQALTKLSTEGLQELGIHVGKAGLSMDDAADRGELFKRVMSELRKESEGVTGAQLSVAEKAAASGVAFQDAMEKMKTAIGQIVVALAPLVEKVAWFISNIPGLMKSIGKTVGEGTGRTVRALQSNSFFTDLVKAGTGVDISHDGYNVDEGGKLSEMEVWKSWYARAQRIQAQTGTAAGAKLGLGFAEEADVTSQVLTELIKILGVGPDGPRAGHKGKGERDKALADALAKLKKDKEERDKAEASWRAASGDNPVDDFVVALKKLTDESARWDDEEAPTNKLEAAILALKKLFTETEKKQEKRKSKLTEMFGPIEEINGYKIAFDALSGSVSAAMDAWITGSMSAGAAIKKFFADALKGLAVQMAVESLKHIAYAVASAVPGVTFNPAAVAGHVKTAALFAGVAAAAVAGAKAMHGGGDVGGGGGGGGASAGASGAAPPPRGSGAPAAAPGKHVVYVIGDPFDTEVNPRRRQQNAKRVLQQVSGDSAGGQEA